MKKLLLILCTVFAIADELPLLEEEKDLAEFVYFSGGVNPLPTVSVGFRKLYSSMGSDISVSGSFFPTQACGKFGVVPIPGLNFKQLFFMGKGWQKLERGSSAFYLGVQTGIYPLGDLSVNLGALTGWQFKRKNRSDFFELAINPILYTNRKLRLAPLASLTYAFMF